MKYGYTIVIGEVDSYPCLRCGDIKKNLEEAIKVNADSVELHLGDPKLADVELINATIKDNLQISAIGTGLSCRKYGFSLTSSDKELVKKSQDALKEYIDLGAKLSANVIIGSIRGKNIDNLLYEEYEKLLLESLAPVIEYAEHKNVTILLETINRYELAFLNTLQTTKEFIQKTQSNHVKILADTFHMNIEETNIRDSIIDAKEYIGHVHTADNTRLEPGTGTFNFMELKNSLQDISYTGSVSMECFNPSQTIFTIENGINYIKNL